MIITPAILTDSFLTLQHQMDLVKPSPVVESVHIDVMDGNFVDDVSVTPLDLTVAEFDDLKIDFHLMVDEPMDTVYECQAIAEYLPIRRIIGHVERMSHQHDFLTEVKLQHWQPGLALNLFTSLEAIDDEVWPELECLLLLGVEAGAQGQTLHPYLWQKLEELRQRPRTQPLHVIVDGGVNIVNIAQLARMDVNECAVGSALWHSQEPVFEIEKLLQQAGEQLTDL